MSEHEDDAFERATASEDCDDSSECLATSHPELGECLAAYKANLSRNLSWVGMNLLGVLFFGGVGTYMVYSDGFLPPELGLAIGQLLTLGLAVAWVVMIALSLRGANADLLLFENGVRSCKGRRIEEFKWADIEAVLEGMSVTTYEHGAATQVKHKIRFHMTDKREIKLDLSFVPDSEEVSAIISGATMPRLVRRVQERLAAGQLAEFGAIKLRPDGLERPGDFSGTQTLTWADLKEFKVDNGYLTIKSQQNWVMPWYWKSIEEIPNVRVLLAFIEHHTSGVPLPTADERDQERALAASR